MGECPQCRTVIPFSHSLKQLLLDCFDDVSAINDRFFAHSLRLRERMEDLRGRLTADFDSSAFDSFCERLRKQLNTSTKKLMSSTELSGLELQVSLISILMKHETHIHLARAVSNLASVNVQTVKQVTSLIPRATGLQQTPTTSAMRIEEEVSKLQ